MIVVVSVAVGVVIAAKMRPVTGHLGLQRPGGPFAHVVATVRNRTYLQTFGMTTLLVTGGFMLMPFGSAFGVHNMGIPLDKLPVLYMATGVCSIIAGPLLGRLSDRVGKYPVFVGGTLLGVVMVLIYTRFGVTPLSLVIVANVILFVGITARMISASALISAVPAPPDRGAFMSVNASTQQIAGGLASFAAGLIVTEAADGRLLRYDILGDVVVAGMLLTVLMLRTINRIVMAKPQ